MGDGMLGTLLVDRALGRFAAAALALTLQIGCSAQRAAVREEAAVTAPAPAAADAGADAERQKLKGIQRRFGQLADRNVRDEQALAEAARLRAELEEMLPTAQRPSSVHYLLSGVMVMLGDKEGALHHGSRAVELSPKDARLRCAKAMLLGMLGRRAEGIEELRQAVELDPQDMESWHMLGDALLDSNRQAEAEAAMRKAIERKPDDLTSLETLGAALIQQDKHEEALRIFQKTLTLNPSLARGYYNIGQTYQLMGRHQESRTAFQRAVELEPDDYRARSKLVQLAQALGDLPARDRELATLYTMHRAGQIKSETFCREQMTIGTNKLMVMEHFELKGPRPVKYVFHILDETGAHSTARFSLGSYDVTNKAMQQTGQQPAGTRLFHLDYYRETPDESFHATFGFFNGAPSYDEVRKIVEDALHERRAPMSMSRVPRR